MARRPPHRAHLHAAHAGRLGGLPEQTLAAQRATCRLRRVRTGGRGLLDREPVGRSGPERRRRLVQDRRLLLPAGHNHPGRTGLEARRGRLPRRDELVLDALVPRIPRRPVHVPHGHLAHDRRRHHPRRPKQFRGQHRLLAAARDGVLESRYRRQIQQATTHQLCGLGEPLRVAHRFAFVLRGVARLVHDRDLGHAVSVPGARGIRGGRTAGVHCLTG